MFYKHRKIQLPFFLMLSGAYIIIKYTISPLLYALRRMGLSSPKLNKIDSKINRTFLPLTERPDEIQLNNIETSLKKGEKLPIHELMFSDGISRELNTKENKGLLLVFVRGSWCSYSRLHLSDLISKQNKFQELGVKLIAITSYKDQEWWRSHGIDIPMAIDTTGAIFNRFGIKLNNWIEFAWWRILPHESVFLFDQKNILIASDVRKVNSIIPGQTFLSSAKWLEIITKNL